MQADKLNADAERIKAKPVANNEGDPFQMQAEKLKAAGKKHVKAKPVANNEDLFQKEAEELEHKYSLRNEVSSAMVE